MGYFFCHAGHLAGVYHIFVIDIVRSSACKSANAICIIVFAITSILPMIIDVTTILFSTLVLEIICSQILILITLTSTIRGELSIFPLFKPFLLNAHIFAKEPLKLWLVPSVAIYNDGFGFTVSLDNPSRSILALQNYYEMYLALSICLSHFCVAHNL